MKIKANEGNINSFMYQTMVDMQKEKEEEWKYYWVW
jgi:hypothetical protein